MSETYQCQAYLPDTTLPLNYVVINMIVYMPRRFACNMEGSYVHCSIHKDLNCINFLTLPHVYSMYVVCTLQICAD